MAKLKSVPHMIDPGLFPILDKYLDHIEPPRQVPRAEALEPGVRPALNQSLLVLSDGIKTTDFAAFAAGFHLDEEQQLLIPRDNVHLAFAGAAEIAGQNLAALAPEPIASDPLAVVSQPDPVTDLAVSRRQTAGTVERPAETSDDGGNKGRVSEALQDVLSCHIPDASQSRIEGTPCRVRA